MKNKIYITGHKNPDTDSICSAIAYATLKSKRSNLEYEPIRLGDINLETQFVLDYFDVKPPKYMESVKVKIKDIELDKAVCIPEKISLYKALQLIREEGVNSLPVINEEEKLIGIVSLSNISKCYMEVWDDLILRRSKTSIDNILEVLCANVLYSPENPKTFDGKITVYAMSPDTIDDYIGEGDIVIIGNRKDAQIDAINKNVSIIILTGGHRLDDEVAEMIKNTDITVISTNYNTFMTARLLPQAVSVSHVMTRNNIVTFNEEDNIDDVRNIMAKSRFRSYPVLNSKGKVVANISRYHLISNLKKNIILVDHNEKNQSIDDIDSAEILEIIDHHRVANISTSSPIYFRNEPVGSSATIIGKMYFEQGVMPSREIAGLLCSAIISDTLLFKSPTSTEVDRMILDRLSKIAGIDPEVYAMEMFKAGTKLENKSMKDLLNGDVKNFMVEKEKIRVCQIFTMDLDSLSSIKEELLENMDKIRTDHEESMFVIMMTDIFKEESEVVVSGNFKEELAKVFGKEIKNGSFIVEGLLSRKKQMIPKISEAVVQSIGTF